MEDDVMYWLHGFLARSKHEQKDEEALGADKLLNECRAKGGLYALSFAMRCLERIDEKEGGEDGVKSALREAGKEDSAFGYVSEIARMEFPWDSGKGKWNEKAYKNATAPLCRVRAKAFGYRASVIQADRDLAERFARAVMPMEEKGEVFRKLNSGKIMIISVSRWGGDEGSFLFLADAETFTLMRGKSLSLLGGGQAGIFVTIAAMRALRRAKHELAQFRRLLERIASS